MDFDTVFSMLSDLIPELREVDAFTLARVRDTACGFCKAALLDLRSELPLLFSMRSEAEEYLAELDQHLREVEHEPDAPCWEKRAHLIQVLAWVNLRSERMLTAVTAIFAFLEEQEGTRVVN